MPDLVRSISRPSPAISVSHSLAMKRSFRLNISLPMRLFAYWRCDLIDRRFPVRTQVVCRVRWRSALPLTLCVRAARRAHSLKGFVYVLAVTKFQPKGLFLSSLIKKVMIIPINLRHPTLHGNSKMLTNRKQDCGTVYVPSCTEHMDTTK